ncbi:LANO_0E12904g1_1 [Lachancea nothofagi CBS 11611]|uniref:LANO_0E12904g1_1 n=1 Tax=Lachancea nothofagi CBS 11611 TaxID=1266666 RepID=A0A1G4JYH5_9SACH|nr:LANO_0E12904g1_1 [Lachancea nothofagi CBS 11611]
MSEMSASTIPESVLAGSGSMGPASYATRSPEDDVIPTAIVIKNIPFAIKKEQLLEVISKMNLPLPYAFNYHFDNGVFRGLAFANFATTDETTQVVHSLNGKEIGGRKLRVEYKKMLPQMERERIEREKREKRGQLEEQHRTTSALSLQSLNKSSSGGNPNANSPGNSLAQLSTNDGSNATVQRPQTPSEGLSNIANQNIPPPLSSNASSQMFHNFVSGGSSNATGAPTNPLMSPQPSMTPQPLLSAQNTATSMALPSNSLAASSSERYYAPLPASTNLPLPPQQLDFNDPDILEIYSQLLLFKDRERAFHELAYPVGLSATHKRVINVLCSFLGLVEVYDPSFIIIRRKILDHAALQSHLQQEGQLSLMQPLQPSSTGGSGMSRSHSYTSLLQAHATAAAAAVNNNNVGQGVHIPPPSQSPLLQPTAVHQLDSQNQQQQSILRPPSTQTPSSSILQNRIPTGYANKHTTPSASNNPLLRNAGVSPTTGQVQPNTTQRMPSFYSQTPSTPNLNENRYNSTQNLVPQHTNSSFHSNYSVHSFHDPSSAAADSQNHGMMYGSASQLGLGPELEGDLSRSLSGLDIQGKRNLWG